MQNSARIRQGKDEDLIERVCRPMQGNKSGEGKNPSFVRVEEVDGKYNLPGNRADGRQITLYRDHVEGIEGQGPFTKDEWLQLEFYRKQSTLNWEVRIKGRTKNPEEKDEWVVRTVAPEAPKLSDDTD